MSSALFVIPANSIGGSERVLLMVAQELDRRGWEVTIQFLSREENSGSGLNLMASRTNRIFIRQSQTKRMLFGAVTYLKHLVKRPESYSLIMTSNVVCSVVVSVFAALRLLKGERFLFRESTRIFSWFRFYKKFAYLCLYSFYRKQDTVVICQTEEMSQELLAHVPWMRARRMETCSNPVDYFELLQKARAETPAPVPNTLPNGRQLVAVGRLVAEKDYPTLIAAFAELPPDWRLFIIGDGPERDRLQALIDQYGLQQRIWMPGTLVNPYPLVRACDIAVSSSKLEGFPNVLREFQCLAPRVVSTISTASVANCGGLITCPPGDKDLLKRALLASANLSSRQLKSKIRSMREEAKAHSLENYVDKLLECASPPILGM